VRNAGKGPSPARRLVSLLLTAVMAVACMILVGASAVAQPPPPPTPPSDEPPAAGQAPLNTFIDPAVLESVQKSIVGLVVIWEEPANPFAVDIPGSASPGAPTPEVPVMSICTGWFDSPTTIATAGHCVDPEQGRLAIDMQQGPPIDPTTGLPAAPAQGVRPEPKRTVWAFQPRELSGAVLTSPVIVRVDSFRPGDEGDTAKLEVAGMPAAQPLRIAPTAPRVGETVTSIGFPGLNIEETDGVNMAALMSGGKTPAEVLQDSRLQPVNTSGTITARQFREGVAVYQVNSDLAEGTSGGPTINSRGEVYGVNSQMTIPFLGQNFNVITDTGMLREFLGHDEEQPPPAPTQSSQFSTVAAAMPTGWVILVSVLGGAVAGALLMWAFGRFTTRSASRRPAEPAEP
jgi:hypothetical protein